MKKPLIIVIVVVVLILMVAGAIYAFSKSEAPSKVTTTKQGGEQKGGLSSLLDSLNLQGLTIFGAGA